MKLKVLLLLSFLFILFSCDSAGGDDPEDDFWGYAKNGDLNIKVEETLPGDYTFLLSQNGTVYVTIDGSEPSATNYKSRFIYDYSQPYSNSDYEVNLERDMWEAKIRAVGVADGYPTEKEDGTKINYIPPKALEGTTVLFEKSVRLMTKPANRSFSDGYLVIPEWGIAYCSGSWTDILGRGKDHFYMEAGTSGTLRYERKHSNTGTFVARYADDSPLHDGDEISAGTQFYFVATQGSKYSSDYSLLYYSFDFWVEE
ncbi:MAG TPA: hypothetical protein GXZ47_10365 [Treponema sp.]|nr:hypothetical protein [Treponema sp.]